MNELYYEQQELPDLDDLDYMGDSVSPLQAKAEDDASLSLVISEKLLEKTLQKIYSKKFDKKKEIEPVVFHEIVKGLNLHAEQGYQPQKHDKDDDFIDAIKKNNEVFAAFKVHRMQNDMAKLLLDEQGKLKSFKQWKEDVLPIATHQVGSWLQTEYNTAVRRAHQAAQWRQFERERDVLPNLKWVKSTSVHPGKDHQVFWGTVLPIDDPFWNDHRPGDRWNCKCSLTATDEPVTSAPTAKIDPPHPGLDNNPGKDAKLFNDSHPYFPSNCGKCPFYKDGEKRKITNKKKDCYNCQFVKDCINVASEKEKEPLMERYTSEGIRFVEHYKGKNNGVVEIFDSGKQNKNEYKKNLKASEILADKGLSYRMLPIIDKEGTNPDAFNLTTKKLADFKVPDGTSGKNIMQSAIKEASRQGVNEIILHLRKHPDSYISMYRILRFSLESNRGKGIQTIIVIYPNNTIIIYDLKRIKDCIKKSPMLKKT